MRGTGRETRKEHHESGGSPRCITGGGKSGGYRDEHKILTNILIQSRKCNNGYRKHSDRQLVPVWEYR